MMICQGCGTEFHRSSKSRDARKYCSRDCSFAHIKDWIHRGEPKVKQQKMQQHCLRCGVDVGMDYQPKYCTSRCRWEAYKSRRPDMLETCRKRQALKYHVVKGRSRARVCPQCEQEFVPLPGDGRKRFCSTACGDKWWSRLYSNAEHRARYWRVEYERGINWRAVVQRDGDICALCGEPVELTGDRRNRLGPTVDHRVPMSRGGAHVWSNVQLAHRACNSSKGAGVAA